MNTTQQVPCNCTECSGTGYTCGCRQAAAHTGYACGPERQCGAGASCAQS